MKTLSDIDQVITQRFSDNSDASYVASLKKKGINKMLEKVGEESTEFIIAAKDLHTARCHSTDSHCDDSRDKQNKEALIGEAADLWFHSLIVLAESGLSSDDILDKLNKRFGVSGITEKASRTTNND